MPKKILLLFCLCLMSTSGMFAYGDDSIISAKATKSLMLDIENLGQGKLVAIGERGHVLVSKDNGTQWRQVIVPTRSTLTALTFINDKMGFAVGHRQTIIKTQDGGESWELLYESDDLDFPALMDVWFRDTDWGIAVGAFGLCLFTKDGGKTWQQNPLSELEDPDFGLPHFYSLAFDATRNLLYMAGELGGIALSKDFGQSWSALESPYSGSYFKVNVGPSGSVHLMGLRGHLFRSDNQGESWSEIETGVTASINNMIYLTQQKAVYVAVDGVLLMTEDDGNSVRHFQRSDRAGLVAVAAIDNNQLVMAGEKGLLVTDQQGQTIQRSGK